MQFPIVWKPKNICNYRVITTLFVITVVPFDPSLDRTVQTASCGGSPQIQQGLCQSNAKIRPCCTNWRLVEILNCDDLFESYELTRSTASQKKDHLSGPDAQNSAVCLANQPKHSAIIGEKCLKYNHCLFFMHNEGTPASQSEHF